MDVEAVKAILKPLNLSDTRVVSEAELEYYRFYGIDFEARRSDVNHFFGSLDLAGFDIACHYYELNQSTATCFILHGYYDHSALYKHMIDYCLSRNMSVVIYDLPGHGLSSGEPAAIKSFEDYQQVLQGVIEFFQPKVSGPSYVIGQSTGGAITMDYILSHSDHPFEKAVLLAPLFKPVGWGLSARFVDLIRPFISSMPRVFTSNSNDKEFVRFLEHDDPMQYRRLSLQWVSALKKWMKHFLSLNKSEQSVLIIQGKKDLTVDWRYNLPIIEQKFPQAQVVYINKGCHHLVCESQAVREEFYQAMDGYLEVQLS